MRKQRKNKNSSQKREREAPNTMESNKRDNYKFVTMLLEHGWKSQQAVELLNSTYLILSESEYNQLFSDKFSAYIHLEPQYQKHHYLNYMKQVNQSRTDFEDVSFPLGFITDIPFLKQILDVEMDNFRLFAYLKYPYILSRDQVLELCKPNPELLWWFADPKERYYQYYHDIDFMVELGKTNPEIMDYKELLHGGGFSNLIPEPTRNNRRFYMICKRMWDLQRIQRYMDIGFNFKKDIDQA